MFVGGLSPATTSKSLLAYFAKYGATAAQVLSDPRTCRSRGFGFVEFPGELPDQILGDHVIDKRTCGVRSYGNRSD